MRIMKITHQEAGQRFDHFLLRYLDLSTKSFIYKMMRKKNITLNGKKAQGNERLAEGDEVTLYLADETIEKFQKKQDAAPVMETAHGLPEILYEDADILVVNKPVGMLSQKAKEQDISLVDILALHIRGGLEEGEDSTFRPGICNRLDRNTSGLVVAGKSIQGLQWMNQAFQKRDVKKYYLCLVYGRLTKEKSLKGYLQKNKKTNIVQITKEEMKGSARIETSYLPLGHAKVQGMEVTLLKVHLITGKSHQIRAHLASIGHPIVGERKYLQNGHPRKGQQWAKYDSNPKSEDGEGTDISFRDLLRFQKDFRISYQLLHAWQLEWEAVPYLPERYHHLKVVAEPPEKFRGLIRKCGLESCYNCVMF